MNYARFSRRECHDAHARTEMLTSTPSRRLARHACIGSFRQNATEGWSARTPKFRRETAIRVPQYGKRVGPGLAFHLRCSSAPTHLHLRNVHAQKVKRKLRYDTVSIDDYSNKHAATRRPPAYCSPQTRTRHRRRTGSASRPPPAEVPAHSAGQGIWPEDALCDPRMRCRLRWMATRHRRAVHHPTSRHLSRSLSCSALLCSRSFALSHLVTHHHHPLVRAAHNAPAFAASAPLRKRCSPTLRLTFCPSRLSAIAPPLASRLSVAKSFE